MRISRASCSVPWVARRYIHTYFFLHSHDVDDRFASLYDGLRRVFPFFTRLVSIASASSPDLHRVYR